MKKLLGIVLITALCLTCACALGEQAEREILTSGDYRYTLLEDGTAEIATYCGSEKQLVIPSQLDGYAVTAIGDHAFYRYESLTSVTIPDSVSAIDDSAFSGCDELTLTVARGSYAEQYCKENDLKYQYPDSLDGLSEE